MESRYRKMEVLLEGKEGFIPAVRSAAQTLKSSGTVILRGRDEGTSLVKQATELLQLHLRGVTSFLLSANKREVSRQLSLPVNPNRGPHQISAIYTEVLQDLEDLLQPFRETDEGNEIEESGEVVVEDVSEAAAQAFRVLSSTGKVTISGLDEGIPNVALVLEQVKAKFLQPPETLSTKVSITLALPGFQAAKTEEEEKSGSDDSSSVEEEEIKRAPRHRGEYKYIKLRPSLTSNYPAPGEVYITIRKPVKVYITEAVQWLRSEGNTRLVLKGRGFAVNQTVLIAEQIKRVVPRLHQIATYGTIALCETYEPTEYGLDAVSIERKVVSLDICLSLRPLDYTDPGYQAPIDSSLVREYTRY